MLFEGATQARPRRLWRAAVIRIVQDLPVALVDIKTEPPIRWPATNTQRIEGLLLKDTAAAPLLLSLALLVTPRTHTHTRYIHYLNEATSVLLRFV